MKRWKMIIVCLLGAVGGWAQPLTQRMEGLLKDPLLKGADASVLVYDLTTDKELYAYRADKLCRPASVEKVLTTVAAWTQLGADYTLDTSLRYTGKVGADSVLRGNLYVVGGFDPEFMETDLDSLLEQLVAGGVCHLTDSLLFDATLTDSLYWGSGWCWDDTPAAFQPYYSSFMLNKGCVQVNVLPTAAGEKAMVCCSPVSGFYTVENRTVSHQLKAGKLRFTRDWLSNGNVLLVEGNVEAPATECMSVYTSKTFFFTVFTERFLTGGFSARVLGEGVCPVDADTLFCLRRPLQEVALEALKESDNLNAEALFFHLVAKKGKRHIGSGEAAQQMDSFMVGTLGVAPRSYRIVDGSGLSNYNAVSARQLMACLQYAYRQPPLFAFLKEALPIAGVDGSLQYRLGKRTTRGRIQAKTGHLTGTSNLAGYATAANGHQLAFVLMNQYVLKASEAREWQDKVCEALVK